MKQKSMRDIERLVRANPRIPATSEEERLWAEIDELAAEISKHWPKGVSAVDAVREQRRNLTPVDWEKPRDARGEQ
jgi:hypothetical protein